MARRPDMAPWAITEARYGSVGHPGVLEKLQDSQFASATPAIGKFRVGFSKSSEGRPGPIMDDFKHPRREG